MDNKLTIMKFGLVVILTVLIGCTNDNLNTPVTLDGKWVEITTKTDTLTFGLMGDKPALILNRGNEMKDGFSIPKSGSGPYDYKLLTNKISLRWYASSNSAFNDYYFNQTGNQIEISNFYDVGSKGTIQTFRKLK
jgi:hypothetical protein